MRKRQAKRWGVIWRCSAQSNQFAFRILSGWRRGLWISCTICYGRKFQGNLSRTCGVSWRTANEENLLFLGKLRDPYSKSGASVQLLDQSSALSIFRRCPRPWSWPWLTTTGNAMTFPCWYPWSDSWGSVQIPQDDAERMTSRLGHSYRKSPGSYRF